MGIQSFDDLWNEVNKNPDRQFFIVDRLSKNLTNLIFLTLNDFKQFKDHLEYLVLIHLFFFVIV